MKEIYLKADDKVIDWITNKVRPMIGKEVRVIDLNPQIVQELDEEEEYDGP